MNRILAINGGNPVLQNNPPDELFRWPIIGTEDEEAVLDVVRNNRYSGIDITMKFEEEFAAWQERKFAIAFCNGTLSLTAAMFAIGLGKGDEIICPTKTYWGSIAQASMFGASVVFCNINEMLSMDPDDLERCVSPRTKAIMVVHYCAYPCDMDSIMAFAHKHGLYVIEDVSHAQGGKYKGKKLGTFGDIAAMSLMSGKSFAAGELGALVTDNRALYERALAFAHYERNNGNYITECDEIKPYFNIALGGVKGRANQVCTALARIQLKYYDERCATIRRAMNRFWDRLEGLPGIVPIRVDESTGSDMAGWYNPHGSYRPEELHGLSVERFCEAMRAEIGNIIWAGGNYCLHTHQYFNSFDYNHSGIPSRIAYAERDVRQLDSACRHSEQIKCFSVPWFKQYMPEWIDLYADAFRKVIENHEELLENSEISSETEGRWYGTSNR